MFHSLFQPTQIITVKNKQIKTKSKSSSSSSNTFLPFRKLNSLRIVSSPSVKNRWKRCSLAVKAPASASSGGVVADGDSMISLEQCFRDSPVSGSFDFAPSSSMPGCSSGSGAEHVMKGKHGAFGGTATLEKAKFDLSQTQSKSKAELSPAIGDGGGGIGKNINNGGGNGGNDGGDDDDYFDNFNDGDDGDEGGLFRRRILFEELFDRKFLEAILNEWQKTVMDLPAGMRQAFKMGLMSSSQLVKFLEIDVRPTAVRAISRIFPEALSRAFIGRMIADPSFLYKFLLDQTATLGFSVYREVTNRKERIYKEWDLALINVLTVCACNVSVFCLLAPCRSYANTFGYDWQNTLHKLPNNVFEISYPQRNFDLQKRIGAFFYKTLLLSIIGATAGAVQGALSNWSASKKEGRLSVSIPSVRSNVLGSAGSLALSSMLYQGLCGMDRALVDHFDVIGVSLSSITALRILNVLVVDKLRAALLGIEVDPLVQSGDILAYNRATQTVADTSLNWFISKNPIVSGLGLLGIKQGNTDSAVSEEPSTPKARRKRIVRKKMAVQ